MLLAACSALAARTHRNRVPLHSARGLSDVLIQAALFGGVAEDEPPAALAARVHNRSLGRGRRLLEHLGAHALDILRSEAPEAAAGKVNRAQQAAALSVADRVLVHAQRSGRVANVQ